MKTQSDYYAERARKNSRKIERARAEMVKAERQLSAAQQRRRNASGLDAIRRAMIAEETALRRYQRAHDRLSVARGF